jgi:hypothetical protein
MLLFCVGYHQIRGSLLPLSPSPSVNWLQKTITHTIPIAVVAYNAQTALPTTAVPAYNTIPNGQLNEQSAISST